ncbi:MAG: hypothetical protein RIT45_1901 [Pseudomonadota bacterium]
MIVPAQDLHRLVIRVAVVTLALRAVSMFSVDPYASEVLAMLPPATLPAEPGRLLLAAWTTAGGGFAAVGRIPTVLADVALVLAIVGYARAAGFGTIAGLVAAAVAAMGPLGLEIGWRAGTPAFASALGMIGLWLLRGGLRRGALGRTAGSAVAFAAASALTPAAWVLLPSALWLSARSVAMPAVRAVGSVGWLVAGGLGAAGYAAIAGSMLPLLGDVAAWAMQPDLGYDAAPLAAPLDAARSALAALSAGGPTGAIARLGELPPAPDWRVWLGAALWPLAAYGLVRGLVREDPAAAEPAFSDAGGAGAADGWRSLGVAHATAPRSLGERDWMPLLLPMLTAAGFAAWQASRSDAAGVVDAVVMARPAAAMLLGLGLAAAALLPAMAEDHRGQGHRQATMLLVVVTMVIFGLGGQALLERLQDIGRTSARKVALFTAEEMAGRGEAVLVGAGGLRIRWKLLGSQESNRLKVVAPAQAALLAGLDDALGRRPPQLVLAGDVEALGEEVAIGTLVDRRMEQAGYRLREDGHRFLADLAVRVYSREQEARDPKAVTPQMAPGVQPGVAPTETEAP